MKGLVVLACLGLCACGGLVTWVAPGDDATGGGGAGSTTKASNVSSTSNSMLDCSKADAFDCKSTPGCVRACLSTPDEGCFATCRPITSNACTKTCDEQAPFCPPGLDPEADGECYTGYCIDQTVCSK